MNNKLLISVKDIYKEYQIGKNSLTVLQDLNLQICNGEIIFILGPSGAGKSTLLHILGFLDKPSGGQILFEGDNVLEFSDKRLSQIRNQNIGFVFQFHYLLPEFSALENVMIPGLMKKSCNSNVVRQEAYDILERVGLKERIHHRPAQLSGGEQQRVAIARALINKPKILLADEPTGDLDHKTGDSIYSLLREFNMQTGQTLLIVTHNEALVGTDDRIIRLVDGRTVNEPLIYKH